jgi:hypothetical protein
MVTVFVLIRVTILRTRPTSQHVLAMAYQADGQVEKAVKVLEHVVAVSTRVNPTLVELWSDCCFRDQEANKQDSHSYSKTTNY